ncbi:nucleotidyltransferase family protein [Sinomonas sp. ASV322]|uniref:nucleotidyltransferase family protein n=1 Tax=Sinomonas sp. ASV322 TaxID=3041920 RepID=UPI0027DC177A|nr:nucleotidyltransferase family protein [Sinomonas sp. ASV322]MDQ4501911.1 nucleotidyltransferase family protein [Sinomonas sp. ASV322]
MLGEHRGTADDGAEAPRSGLHPADLPLADLPLAERIQLAHALIEWISAEAGIDLLHIKGYAADGRLYAPGRASSDVDLLVRPSHTTRLIEALLARGWEIAATFESGSLFHHAMTLWNGQWGHVDIHRAFPGVGLSPDLYFDLLWSARSHKAIANRQCRVPSFDHQALMIVLHGARDPFRGPDDVRFVRDAVGSEGWARLEALAGDVDAQLGLAAATGRLDEWEGHPERGVWDVVSRGGTRVELFGARWRACRTARERFALVRSAVVVNRDHLRMKLLREPTASDYGAELRSRIIEVVRAVPRRRRARRSRA